MNAEARADRIASYGNAHTLLVDTLQQFPRAMWRFKPAPDRWSIHEILIHLSDSEAHSYIRCRTYIAQPGQTLMAYDENQWAVALRYHDQRIEAALDLIKWLHLRTYTLIQTLPNAVWSHTLEHPEHGTMSLEDWLVVYERHIPEHIDQMKDVYAAWLARRW
jgi:DinB superfamily